MRLQTMDIVRVIIKNEPSGMTESDAEYRPLSPTSVRVRRREGESVAEFQDRAAAEAEAAGAISVIFGEGSQQS
jgi:hypothetical protein